MTPEELTCEGCRRVNPGGLRETEKGLLCGLCRIKPLVNQTKYKYLEDRAREQGITRPSLAEIMVIIDVEKDQAGNYRRYYKLSHPEHYRVSTNGGNITQEIKKED